MSCFLLLNKSNVVVFNKSSGLFPRTMSCFWNQSNALLLKGTMSCCWKPRCCFSGREPHASFFHNGNVCVCAESEVLCSCIEQEQYCIAESNNVLVWTRTMSWLWARTVGCFGQVRRPVFAQEQFVVLNESNVIALNTNSVFYVYINIYIYIYIYI